MTPRADRHVGLVGQRHDPLSIGNPAPDLLGAGESFGREVSFLQEPPVVFLPRVNPRRVDVGQRDRFQRHAGGLRHEGLHGDVVAVIVLHAGGGFHLDHPPDGFPLLGHGQHHVRESQGAVRLEARFKNRLPGFFQQLRGAGKGGLVALDLGIDEGAFFLRVVDAPGDVAHLVSSLKRRFRLGRNFAQIRPMDFQPETLRALAVGDEFGFGERGHRGGGWIRF